MYENEQKIKVFRVTVKKILERLSVLKDCDVSNFKDLVIEQFDGYDYEGEEELIGFDLWPNLNNDGSYQLNIKIDHQHAYEFTLFVEVNNQKVTIKNVL